MEYNTQKIRLRFFQEIVYQAEGVEKHLMLDGDRKSDGQVEGVIEIIKYRSSQGQKKF